MHAHPSLSCAPVSVAHASPTGPTGKVDCARLWLAAAAECMHTYISCIRTCSCCMCISCWTDRGGQLCAAVAGGCGSGCTLGGKGSSRDGHRVAGPVCAHASCVCRCRWGHGCGWVSRFVFVFVTGWRPQQWLHIAQQGKQQRWPQSWWACVHVHCVSI